MDDDTAVRRTVLKGVIWVTVANLKWLLAARVHCLAVAEPQGRRAAVAGASGRECHTVPGRLWSWLC